MVGFFIGLFVGAFIGITVMCLCTAAGQADKYEIRTERISNFIRFDDTISEKLVVSLLVKRR